MKVLHLVTNVDQYPGSRRRTGLWLSELSHAWDVFAAAGFEQVIASPKGGRVPIDPMSLKFPPLDSRAKDWLSKRENRALLANTVKADALDLEDVDAVFFVGGHGTMFDFTYEKTLNKIARTLFEDLRIVAAVCHGYCGLLNAKLSDGSYLVAGRDITGFSWNEEILAGVAGKVPYNCEKVAKERGARYSKALLPFMANTVRDENLITGQNPFSADATAKLVVSALNAKLGNLGPRNET